MSPQAGWILQEEIVPRLRSAIPRTVSCVGAEDAEELVQDATAIAAKMLHNVKAAGKKVTPGNIGSSIMLTFAPNSNKPIKCSVSSMNGLTRWKRRLKQCLGLNWIQTGSVNT